MTSRRTKKLLKKIGDRKGKPISEKEWFAMLNAAEHRRTNPSKKGFGEHVAKQDKKAN
jgi:hypothetical protein